MSSLPLITHRMLISALPHEQEEPERVESSASAERLVLVEGCPLPARDFSELMERDTAFNQPEPDEGMHHQ